MNRFAEALNSGRLIVTAECLAPPGADADAVRRIPSLLPPALDAVVVPDNPDRIRSSAFSAAAILTREKRAAAILTMATRDRNRLALLSDALGAAALGIAGILCISGKHQSLGVCPQAAAANDIDSVQFIQAMKRMVLYGCGPNGKELESGLDLQIGAAAHPYQRPMELNLLRLKKKIKVGADFLLTQAVFDLDGFSRWMEAVREADLDKRTAIIASVMPLTGVEEARALQRSRMHGPIGEDIVARIGNARHPVKEGVSIASEMAARLKEMPGVRGIHILSGGRESLASAVTAQAGIGEIRGVDAFPNRIKYA